MSEQPDLGHDVDEFWRQAERNAVVELSRARRRARMKLAARWIPHVLAASLLLAGVGWYAQSGQFEGFELPHLSLPTMADDNDEAVAKALAEAGAKDEPAPLPLSEGELLAPFVGTPAAKYPIGAAGLVPPPAKALGKHSAAEVGAAFAATQQLLVLSRLDDRALVRRDPSAFLNALAPKVRAQLAATAKQRNQAVSGVSSLAPGQQQLAPARVTGSMKAVLGRNGYINVVTNYVFVYALKPSWPVEDRSYLHLIVRADATFEFVRDSRYSQPDQGVWLADLHEHWWNVSCKNSARGLLALPAYDELFKSDPFDDRKTAEERKRQYRADVTMPTSDGCPDPAKN